MATPFHLLVAGNPVIIYASRKGTPNQVRPFLERFLDKFWQERDIFGSAGDTSECLVAQLVVRFGFEFCEDDYSNLRVGVKFDPNVEYLYLIDTDRTVSVWVPQREYRQNPTLGLEVCQRWLETAPQSSMG
jgi:hypothetical protein